MFLNFLHPNTEKSTRGGVYVHIPFCKGKCTYCSFYSVGGVKNVNWDNLADSIIAELSDRMSEMEGWKRITIYIGGGTPSLMVIKAFERMLSGIRNVVKDVCGEDVEIIETTIEVNPDDVDEEKVLGWKNAGVDRVSMGVQSMVDEELKAIGRRHSARQVEDAYNILRREFDNISLDLIFGLPLQTLGSLDFTLDTFVRMRPEHISAYSLMYEEKSILTRQLQLGKIEETPEDLSVEMFKLVSRRLREVGYERYEISNYALPGRRSKHNSSYWEGIPYIGLGPSAHSYNGKNIRKWNEAKVGEELRGNSPHCVRTTIKSGEVEYLSEDELREERIMTRLRVKEGLDLKRFEEEFGRGELKTLEKKIIPYLKSGDLIIKDDHLILTESGVMISDEIISDIF